METVNWKYVIGQEVLVDGRPGKVKWRGHNINGIPVYMVNGKWWKESDVELPSTPCPV